MCVCVWWLRHSLKGLNSVYVIKLKFIIKAAFGLAWLYISPPPPTSTRYCLAYCPHTYIRMYTQKQAAHVVVLCKLVFKFCDHTNKMSAHTNTRTRTWITYIWRWAMDTGGVGVLVRGGGWMVSKFLIAWHLHASPHRCSILSSARPSSNWSSNWSVNWSCSSSCSCSCS